MSRPRVLATGLDTLPDVTIGHVSSFLQFKVVARLLKVSKSTQEAVYASGGRGQFGRRRVEGQTH